MNLFSKENIVCRNNNFRTLDSTEEKELTWDLKDFTLDAQKEKFKLTKSLFEGESLKN